MQDQSRSIAFAADKHPKRGRKAKAATPEADLRRLLIATLFQVTPTSQAAICREAGVPESSASRFRRVGGDHWISARKQGDVLRALGHSGDHPLGGSVVVWDVEDDIRPVRWLLENALATPATLALVDPLPGPRFPFRELVAAAAGEARLLIRSRKVSLSELFPLPASPRRIHVKEAAIPRLCRKHVEVADFDSATSDLLDVPRKPRSTSGLLRQVRTLGLTDGDLQPLLMHWLIRRARTDGAALAEDLLALDVLELDTGTVAPSKLTPAQRSKLVEKLARRQELLSPPPKP